MLRHVEENGIPFPEAGLSVMTITNLSQTLLNTWVVVKDRHFPYFGPTTYSNTKKRHIFVFSPALDKEKILSLHEKLNSDLRILCSDALQLSHRDFRRP